MSEKTIGIVGGMGPYATAEFYKTLIKLNQVTKDWEHSRILIDSNTKIPSRTRALLYNEESPAEGTINSINDLASIGADFVALPCNSIHYWYNKIQSKIKIPWINMIEVVSEEVKKHGFSRPLILGGYVVTEKKIYNRNIKDAQYLDEEGNKIVQKAITEIKNTGKLEKRLDKQIEEKLFSKEKYFDSIVFACTELTENLIGKYESIDSNKVYARVVLDFAKE